jgi:small-conductance mechanosensitive channel
MTGPGARAGYAPAQTVIVFVILGHVPLVLLVCLFGLLYLAWLDLRGEDLQPQVALWWYLLVLLTHVAGYAALRVWLLVRHRRAGARRPAGRA